MISFEQLISKIFEILKLYNSSNFLWCMGSSVYAFIHSFWECFLNARWVFLPSKIKTSNGERSKNGRKKAGMMVERRNRMSCKPVGEQYEDEGINMGWGHSGLSDQLSDVRLSLNIRGEPFKGLKKVVTRSVLFLKNYRDNSVENGFYRFKTSYLSFRYSIILCFPFCFESEEISQGVPEPIISS